MVLKDDTQHAHSTQSAYKGFAENYFSRKLGRYDDITKEIYNMNEDLAE